MSIIQLTKNKNMRQFIVKLKTPTMFMANPYSYWPIKKSLCTPSGQSVPIYCNSSILYLMRSAAILYNS